MYFMYLWIYKYILFIYVLYIIKNTYILYIYIYIYIYIKPPLCREELVPGCVWVPGIFSFMYFWVSECVCMFLCVHVYMYVHVFSCLLKNSSYCMKCSNHSLLLIPESSVQLRSPGCLRTSHRLWTLEDTLGFWSKDRSHPSSPAQHLGSTCTEKAISFNVTLTTVYYGTIHSATVGGIRSLFWRMPYSRASLSALTCVSPGNGRTGVSRSVGSPRS